MERQLREYRKYLVEMKTWAEEEMEKNSGLPRNFNVVQAATWALALERFDAAFKDIGEGE